MTLQIEGTPPRGIGTRRKLCGGVYLSARLASFARAMIGTMDEFPNEEAAWAWAAGLFEGEGCILVKRDIDKRTGTIHRRRWLSLGMCDEDVVRRFWQVVGGCEPILKPIRDPRRRDQWVWRCNRWLDIERILGGFMPYFGERRAAKAREMLALPVGPNIHGKSHCVNGHPLTGDNVAVTYDLGGKTPGRVRRRCKLCRERQAERSNEAARQRRAAR